MNQKPEHYEELTRLISLRLDDRLSAPEMVRLESLLETDPAARRLYLQMVDQELEISLLATTLSTQEHPQAESFAKVLSLQTGAQSVASTPKRSWRLATAAAVLVVMLILLLIAFPDRWQKKVEPQRISSNQEIALTKTWNADFESGEGEGWLGRLISVGLPPGSRFGIIPVTHQFPDSAYEMIRLPEEWAGGLFALTERSTLNVTYFLGNRADINIFMHSIPPGFSKPDYHMFQLMGASFPGKTGEWQTASIPFSKFQRKVFSTPQGGLSFVGGPPKNGERVTSLAFSSSQKIVFVIDRVWITPSGPDREEIRPLTIQSPP